MKSIRYILTTYRLMIVLGVAVLITTPVRPVLGDEVFYIERPRLGLGASYEFEEEERTLPDTKTETTTHDMRENMTIGTNGWLYHPNLMEYRLSFEPEWRQERFRHSQTAEEETAESDREHTSVQAYGAETAFFKQKLCSFDLFANRSNRNIDLSYTQDSDIDMDTWGGRLRFTNPVLPVFIGFTNRKTDQTGFYRSDEARDEVQVKIGHNAKRSVSELNIRHDDAERTTRISSEMIDTSSDTTNGELTNTLIFTDDERLKLDSLIYLGEAKYDDVTIDTRLLTENFFWTHSKNLMSQYTATINRNETDDTASEGKALKALLTHHLGDTLTTNLGIEGTATDYSGGGEDRYGSMLGFNYRRPIPWGSVELRAVYDYGLTQREGTGKVIPTESRHILSSGEKALLKEQNIVVESVMVTDTTGVIVYAENIDYRILETGPEMWISRTLMGAIADGQEVVVRYSYQVDAGYDDSRFGQEYRFDLALWSMMSFTYTHQNLDQHIESGEPPPESVRLDDTIDSLLLRFDSGWSETRLEYEKQDRENENSLVTKSIGEWIRLSRLRFISCNLTGEYGTREFTDIDEKETFTTMGADIGWSPKGWYTVSLIGLKTKIFGDLEDESYSEISPKVRLTYGAWTASVAWRLTDQKDRNVDNSLWRQQIYCMVNRSLW